MGTPSASMNHVWRKGINNIVFTLTAVCTVFTIGILFFIFGYILYQGATSLDWNFFTKLPSPPGESGGGMAHAIVGTLKILLVAILIGAPIGLFAGIYLCEFGRRGRMAYCVRYAADLLNGIPSIVIGIFVYITIVLPMKQFSTLSGGIALAIIMVPIVLKGTEEFLKMVPTSLREAGLALGMPEWRVILTIVVPTAFSGIMTSVMLGIARVAGETAPLIFTAFGNSYWSSGWMEPTASLPVMIYTYSISPYADWQRQAWAAGMVLLLMIFFANILSRGFLQKKRISAR